MKQWFNCNTVDEGNKFKHKNNPNDPFGDIRSVCHKNLGKHFKISTNTDNEFETMFCQVGENSYKFISLKSGNRIIDDNREIKTAIALDQIEKPASSHRINFAELVANIVSITRLGMAIDMNTPFAKDNTSVQEKIMRMRDNISICMDQAYENFKRITQPGINENTR